MTFGSKLAWDDTVLPFQLDLSDIRGRVARLDGVLGGILRQHDYPPQVEALVAEMALLTALIGQTIKLRWKLSLQVQSKGPVRMIATDYFAPHDQGEPARIRAYASYDAERLTDGAPFDQIGEGYFAILIDQGKGSAPYQGITPLTGRSLSACAEAYFAQSEQLPTRFALSFGRVLGAGHRPSTGARAGSCCSTCPRPRPSWPRGAGTGEILSAADLVDGDARRELEPGEHPARHGRGPGADRPDACRRPICWCASSTRRCRGSSMRSRCVSAAPVRRIACARACRSIPRATSRR